MKNQIARLSPHQNGKVFAVLTAVGSLVFFMPFLLYFMASAPQGVQPSLLALLAMPFFYLIAGYVMVAGGCLVYNFMFRYIGGFEFESTSSDA